VCTYSPELFDYNELIGKDTTSALKHAFTVAQEQLGVLQLLDPEGLFVLQLCYAVMEDFVPKVLVKGNLVRELLRYGTQLHCQGITLFYLSPMHLSMN